MLALFWPLRSVAEPLRQVIERACRPQRHRWCICHDHTKFVVQVDDATSTLHFELLHIFNRQTHCFAVANPASAKKVATILMLMVSGRKFAMSTPFCPILNIQSTRCLHSKTFMLHKYHFLGTMATPPGILSFLCLICAQPNTSHQRPAVAPPPLADQCWKKRNE